MRKTDHTVRLHGTLKGRVAWALINPDGSVAQSGEQDNLILDRGLNAFGTDTGHTTLNAGGSTAQCRFGNWRRFLAVGTGSTAPAASQTALVSEVARAQDNGGFNSEQTETYTVSGGQAAATLRLVRVINFTASHNLNEFGLSDVSTAGGTVNIRELFRDQNGNPITLSVQSGQQLKLTHTLTITLPFGAADAGFTITNIGAVQGRATFYATTSGSGQSVNLRDEVFAGVFNPSSAAYLGPCTTLDEGAATSATVMTGSTQFRLGTVQAYTAGTFKRTKQYVLSTSQGNGDLVGWFITSNNSTSTTHGGFKFRLTAPATITKDSTKQLTLNFEVSWGRAA